MSPRNRLATTAAPPKAMLTRYNMFESQHIRFLESRFSSEKDSSCDSRNLGQGCCVLRDKSSDKLRNLSERETDFDYCHTDKRRNDCGQSVLKNIEIDGISSRSVSRNR